MTAITSKPRDLPKLPSVIEVDHNLEEIDLSTASHMVTKAPIPTVVTAAVEKAHKPSPLKYQVPVTRSSSLSSSASNSSGHSSRSAGQMSNSSSSASSSTQYIIQLDKTPTNLTPSQRMQMRKIQLNSRIAKFKSDETNIRPNVSAIAPVPIPLETAALNEIDDQDEEIDENDVFNAPLSQQLMSINQREKFLFDNTERKFSLTNTESTRASSMMSHESFNDTSSSVSVEGEELSFYKMPHNPSFTSIEFNSISKDAQELTLLFNKDESIQIMEESARRKQMLQSFSKVNTSLPSVPLPEMKQPTLRSVSSTVFENPKAPSNQVKRMASHPVLPSQVNTVPPKVVAPVSKYYSFTRPAWLPPKSSYDKRKHQKESEDIIHKAILRESQEQAKKLQLLESIKKLKIKDKKNWESLIATSSVKEYENKVASIKKFSDMYWRGIPEDVRSKVWWKNLNYVYKFHYNENSKNHSPNKFSENYCDYFFQRYDTILSSHIKKLDEMIAENKQLKASVEKHKRDSGKLYKSSVYVDIKLMEEKSSMKLATYLDFSLKNCNNIKLSNLWRLHDHITNELLDVFPDMNYFQSHPNLQKLRRILICFVLHLHKLNGGLQDIDLMRFYSPVFKTIAAIFHYNFRNSYKTFVTICQFYSNHLSSLLLNLEMVDDSAARSIIHDSLTSYFINDFENKFKLNLNRLHTHFKVIGLVPIEYLSNMILGLFTNLLDFELSNHIMDLFVFECSKFEEFVMKLVLGFLKHTSHKLFGSKEEVISILRGESLHLDRSQDIYRYFCVGDHHDFIDVIRGIKI
ncbi:uncharacterized protein RJT20DRAFT_125810 [Scheffersomyces xylosifermentans]|uniref:uncharacterized protein n=1 Tax=Scheffersomyces xylosifermentans TaxID=1304137 RepID=UPI00315D61D3